MPDGFPALEPDAEVELAITLPGRRPLRAAGDVRHVTELLTERFFGVELLEISPAHRAVLEAYVADRLRDEAAPGAASQLAVRRRAG